MGEERTGWRDKWISEKHHEWGLKAPAIDIDFLLLEYNHGITAAFAEYKLMNYARMPDLNNPNSGLHAVADVCRKIGVPALLVFYNSSTCHFRVLRYDRPGEDWQDMSEREYVAYLHEVRGERLSPDLAYRLSDYKPRVASRRSG